MARLIDADKLMDETVWKCGGNPFDQYYMGYQDALDNVEATIDAQDAVDAVEVVHGRWVYYSTTMQECSNCQRHTARHKFKYCPHCGAVMEDNYHKSTD